MKPRIWIITFIAILLLGRLLLTLLNICVDPYDVFGSNFLNYSHATNERFVKIDHLLKDNHKYNSYIFGSSKANVLSPEMIRKYAPRNRYYNLSMKSSSLFTHWLHLKYLLRNDFEVRNILLTIDLSLLSPEYFAPFVGEPHNLTLEHFPHPSVLNESYALYYTRYLKKLSPKAFLSKTQQNLLVDKPNQLDIESGVYHWYQQEREIQENHEEYIMAEDTFHKNTINRYVRISNDSIEAINRIINICDENNINLTIVILPLNYTVLNLLTARDYVLFLRNLSELTSFWDFSGYHSVATDYHYFYDYQHFRPIVAEMMFAKIFNDKNYSVPVDFGFLVNQQTITPHIIELSYQIKKADIVWK